MTTRVALQPGFVLHTRPYRETSLLVDAFTPEYGRVGLVARGARRPRSRLRPLLQPFRALLLSWSGRGDLATLVGVEEGLVSPGWTSSGLLSGFYVNELVLRLVPRNDPHPGLFERYAGAVAALGEQEHTEAALRIFEKGLLEELGYALVLDQEAEGGGEIVPDRLYHYAVELGPVPAEYSRPEAGVLVHGSALLSLAEETLSDVNDLREIKQLMRAVLSGYLGEQPLRSRKLATSMHQDVLGGFLGGADG